ncbi:hypothetical protein [Streptomyces sp. NPDC058739]
MTSAVVGQRDTVVGEALWGVVVGVLDGSWVEVRVAQDRVTVWPFHL